MSHEHDDSERAIMLARIKRNIRNRGYHLYIVTNGVVPRYAYTIGLQESLGAELIVGGATYYMADEIQRIVRGIREQKRSGSSPDTIFRIGDLGAFVLRRAHASWTSELMLGALEYYQTHELAALQVVPDEAHWTIDIPDMRREFNPQEEAVWRWMREA